MTSGILGLDISTSTTGYTVLNACDGSLITIGFIKTHNVKCVWDKLEIVNDRFDEIAKLCDSFKVYIEQPLQRFRQGFSSSHTLATLLRYNGIVSYSTLLKFDARPEYIAAVDARRICGVKIRRAKSESERRDPLFAKSQIFDQMLAKYGDLECISWEKTRPTKKNPAGRLKDQCYDMIDSYVIARAAYEMSLS